MRASAGGAVALAAGLGTPVALAAALGAPVALAAALGAPVALAAGLGCGLGEGLAVVSTAGLGPGEVRAGEVEGAAAACGGAAGEAPGLVLGEGTVEFWVAAGEGPGVPAEEEERAELVTHRRPARLHRCGARVSAREVPCERVRAPADGAAQQSASTRSKPCRGARREQFPHFCCELPGRGPGSAIFRREAAGRRLGAGAGRSGRGPSSRSHISNRSGGCVFRVVRAAGAPGQWGVGAGQPGRRGRILTTRAHAESRPCKFYA